MHAKWLKLNDRLLVRMEDGPGADTQGKGAVEIDGHGYNLKTYPILCCFALFIS